MLQKRQTEKFIYNKPSEITKEKMNHTQHKFSITIIVFFVMIIAILLGLKFIEINFAAMNFVMMLVNSLLLLIVLGLLLHIKDKYNSESKKRG